MIFTLFLIGVVASLIYLYLAWNNNHWKQLGLPHPKPSLFVGNTPSVITLKRNGYYDTQDIYKKYHAQFRFVGFYSFRKPTILAMDPALVRQIFLTDFNKFADNDFGTVINKDIDPILGGNPFFLKGAEWKQSRAEVTPAFTASRLRALYPIIESVCQNLTDYIDKELRIGANNGLDARELSAKYTTDVVSNCIFSLDAGSLKDNDAVIRKMAKQIFRADLRTLLLFVFPAINSVLRMRLIPKNVEEFFTGIMKEAAHSRRNSKVDKADILQHLLALQDKKNFDDVQLVANAITFFIDGFETSSISMSLILFELARDQRVQQKLRTEIVEAEKKAPLTMDSIAALPYLEQVIYEALRLNPVVPALLKVCTEECEIPLTRDGKKTFTIPVGTSISIPVYDIHRDPENFKDPLEFKPERFDEDRGGLKAYKDSGSLLVFGMGPRVCLGQRFALTMMRAGLVDIIKSYKVTLNSKTKVPLVLDPKEFLNVPVGGLWLNFEKL